MNDLTGTCAYVTGVGKGIGREITLRLLEEGVNVAGITRTGADLESLAEEGSRFPGVFRGFALDISSETDVRDSVDQAAGQFGTINHLINNAGIGYLKPIEDLTLEEWDRMFDVNVRGTFVATKSVLPYMIRNNRGTIINIASIAGKRGFAQGTGYAASKFAVMGFTESLMLDVRKYNIRVIAVCPGSVATHFHEGRALKKMPGTVLTPEDCAETVAYALKLPPEATAHVIELRVTNP